MNDAKYIGLDVHQATIAVAVRDFAGQLVVEAILETKAETLLQFFRGLRGSLHVTFEEGTWAAWLHDLLLPHVARVLVCDSRKNALLKAGNKRAHQGIQPFSSDVRLTANGQVSTGRVYSDRQSIRNRIRHVAASKEGYFLSAEGGLVQDVNFQEKFYAEYPLVQPRMPNSFPTCKSPRSKANHSEWSSLRDKNVKKWRPLQRIRGKFIRAFSGGLSHYTGS